jgi:hypothetical protein
MTKGRVLGWLAAVAIVIGSGVAGYLFGHETAPTADDARAEREAAYTEAFEASRRNSRRSALRRGHKVGIKKGRRAWAELGSRQGERAGQSEADLRDAQAAADTAEVAAAETTQAAAPPTTGCGAGQYNYNGYGCVPLDCPGDGCAHPPTPPATPESCPPGTVPVGVTGACGTPKS